MAETPAEKFARLGLKPEHMLSIEELQFVLDYMVEHQIAYKDGSVVTKDEAGRYYLKESVHIVDPQTSMADNPQETPAEKFERICHQKNVPNMEDLGFILDYMIEHQIVHECGMDKSKVVLARDQSDHYYLKKVGNNENRKT